MPPCPSSSSGAAAPPTPRRQEPELYVDALVSSRARAGERIGARLIAHAAELARAAGLRLLRVDCWAGAPPLVAFYEAQGFARSGTFDVGGWQGQVFAMRP